MVDFSGLELGGIKVFAVDLIFSSSRFYRVEKCFFFSKEKKEKKKYVYFFTAVGIRLQKHISFWFGNNLIGP